MADEAVVDSQVVEQAEQRQVEVLVVRVGVVDSQRVVGGDVFYSYASVAFHDEQSDVMVYQDIVGQEQVDVSNIMNTQT